MNESRYLSKLSVLRENVAPDVKNLRLLQRQHLLKVPFENLNIHWKQPIKLDTALFFEKIVGQNRGGFCYELNGLFNELLISLGFKTRLVSARVLNGTTHGPEFDHAAIIVSIGKDGYLADVGFGDFTVEPLRFSLDDEQQDAAGVFVIRRFDNDYFEVAKRDGEEWKSEYIFQDIERELSEFKEMCDFQQYSPESHFTKGKVCSILMENGRKTLTDKSFLITENGEKKEKPIDSDEEFALLLDREFGIRKPSRNTNLYNI